MIDDDVESALAIYPPLTPAADSLGDPGHTMYNLNPAVEDEFSVRNEGGEESFDEEIDMGSDMGSGYFDD